MLVAPPPDAAPVVKPLIEDPLLNLISNGVFVLEIIISFTRGDKEINSVIRLNIIRIWASYGAAKRHT